MKVMFTVPLFDPRLVPWTLQHHGDPADYIAVPKGGLYGNRL
jgi:hypothetical protein